MKRAGWVTGGIIVAVVLAAASVVAVRLLNDAERVSAAGGNGSRRQMVLAVNDGSGPVSVRISIVPAPELPDRKSDGSGLFARREDNSLFVGTGNIEVGVEVDGATGDRTFSATSSSPEVEVVVTGDSLIYRDDTEISPGEPAERKNGERTIQQVLQPDGSLEEIGENTELEVWGERRGDRVVAEVLVYRLMNG